MEKQIEVLQEQVKKAYKDVEKNRYSVHAVCIHEGSAESGHYYTFIKDHNQNKWRKYNDIRVTEVEEKEVYEEANGGSSNSTAFWAVYINESLLEESRKTEISNAEKNVLYKNALSQDIEKYVQGENAIVNKQYEDFKDNEVISVIDTKYTERVRYFDKMFQGIPSNKIPQYLTHSSIFAFWWSKRQQDQVNDCKRIILDQVVKHTCTEKQIQQEQYQRIFGKITQS